MARILCPLYDQIEINENEKLATELKPVAEHGLRERWSWLSMPLCVCQIPHTPRCGICQKERPNE